MGSSENCMIRYQVRFELPQTWMDGCHEYVIAATENNAIDRIKSKYPTSYGHWVNRLANEAV